jgi:hypothetical protein
MAQLPNMMEEEEEVVVQDEQPRLLPRIRQMLSRDRRPRDVLPPIQEMEGYYDEPVVPQEQADRMYFESMGRDIEGFDVDEFLRLGEPKPQPEAPEQPTSAINDNVIDAVIQIESSNRWDAVSTRGAVGLMQVRPQFATKPGFGAKNVFDVAEELGYDSKGIKRNTQGARQLLFDPEINRAYGTQYLKALYESFDKDLDHALIAYNWGPTNARPWVERGADMQDPELPTETRDYVSKVRAEMERIAQVGMEEENDVT